MRSLLSSAALAAGLILSRVVDARAVFAHYMVGTVTEEHAHKDIDDAIAMGLDAFALNIGYPQASFVYPALSSLFGYADYLNSQGKNFKLLVSMDLWAAGDVKHSDGSNVNAFDYGDIFNEFIGRKSYYRGPNGAPFVTTFSDGGMTNASFIGWRNTLSKTGVYFVPDLDHTEGFNTSHPYWWDYWGPTFDGVTAWETAWTKRAGYGGDYPGDVSWDRKVIEGTNLGPGTVGHGKTYMMPLSSIQYKNAYSTNVYREGGINLVQRMENILTMGHGPDFIQIITWNDGPESHYIGNIWPEQNTDYAPSLYMSSTKGDHKGWQPIIASFIAAFKSGATAKSQMQLPAGTPSGTSYSGAVWYKKVLQSANCAGAIKPDGFNAAKDKVTWAVIVDGSATFSVSYGSQSSGNLAPGLNFGEFDMAVGVQRVNIINQNTKTVVGTASGGPCSYASCPDGIYNMNVEVVSFKKDSPADVNCFPATYPGGVFLETPPTDGYKFKDKASVCKLDPDKMSSEDLWEQSGAREFLDWAVNKWPTGNIDKRMEMLARSTAQTSVTCSTIPLGSCLFAEETCEKQLGPGPEPYFIRQAFHNYNLYLATLYLEKFIETTEAAGTVVDSMVDTFGKQLLKPRYNDQSGGKDFIKVVGGVLGIFGIALAVPAATEVAGAVLGIAGAAAGFVDYVTKPKDVGDVLKDMADTLRGLVFNAFDNYRITLRNASAAVFDTGDLSTFPDYAFVSGGQAKTKLGQIFDKGRYLKSPPALSATIQAALNRGLKISILNMILNLSNVYVIIGAHSQSTEGNKCDFDGSIWDGQTCHAIEYSGAGPVKSTNDLDTSVYTLKLSSEIWSALLTFGRNPAQNFDPGDIIKGSEACQAATKKFNGAIDERAPPAAGYSNMPLCTWNLPVIDVTPYTDHVDGTLSSVWFHSPCKIREKNRNNIIVAGAKPGIDYLPPTFEKYSITSPKEFTYGWCFPHGAPS